MNQKSHKEVSGAPERILGRKLARELSREELKEAFGGHTPPKGETCSGEDCDIER
jgi:hypothetical protein